MRSGVPGDVGGGDGGGEVVLVDPGVVVGAEQGQVGQGGGPAVGPVLDVVGVAPLRWSPASGEGAPCVAGPECGLQGGGDQAFGAPDVQGLALAAQHDRDDGGVAGELADGLGGQGGAGEGEPGAVRVNPAR